MSEVFLVDKIEVIPESAESPLPTTTLPAFILLSSFTSPFSNTICFAFFPPFRFNSMLKIKYAFRRGVEKEKEGVVLVGEIDPYALRVFQYGS